MLTPDKIKELVKNGESYILDLKVSVPSKVRELAEEICSFANADGGFLFIGVDNKNNIVGTVVDNTKRSAIQDSINSISPAIYCEQYVVDVDGKSVWVIEVPRGTDRPYIYGGSVYVRQGANAQMLRTRDEMLNFFRECNSVHYDSMPARNCDLMQELDETTFKDFCRKARISDIIDKHQILDNIGAFDMQTGLPKAGAVMFFAKDPQRYYSQSWVHCVRFKGSENVIILDDKRYNGTIPQQYQSTLNWLKDKLELRIVIDDAGPHKEILELPEDALREALINALSHRDYYETGAVTVVAVYDDRVVISNPGGLLSGVAENFGHKSLSRNPLIFGLFTRMQLVEQVGSGIPRMQALMKEMELPVPTFQKDGMFTITFERKNVPNNDSNVPNNEENVTNNDINVTNNVTNGDENVTNNEETGLTNRQQEIIELIKNNSRISATEIASSLSVTIRTIRRDLIDMQKLGVLKRDGNTKAKLWILTN